MMQVLWGENRLMETRVHIGHGPCRRLAPFPPSLLLIGMLVGSIGVQSMANAATYCLNNASGNDNYLGTVDHPWRTLVKVQSGASAGDTIVIQSADASTYAAQWPAEFSYRATALGQFAITWTFDTDYSVGQFANGDFWVVGPVKIVGIDPPSTSIDGRVMNGSMVNPHAGWGIAQGYDSAMPNNTYDAAANVAFNRSARNPLVLPAHSSLISSISIADTTGKTQLLRAAILTVLAAPAKAGDFRPPYCGSDKTPKFNVSMLDRSLLLSLAPVASTPSLAEVEGYFAAPWIDHQAGWLGDEQHPKLNMPDYGREMYTQIGIGALMLHLNFTTPQKETLLGRYVQLGIDLYGVVVNGGTCNWPAAGGHGGGRKWPILFAGIMLNDPDMKSIGTKSGDYLYQNGYGPGHCPPAYVYFGEDDQTFYVAKLDVDITHRATWNPDSRDAQRIPYETSDIGLPEWGIEHQLHPEQSNKWLPTMYRAVAGPPFHGTALAALLMDGAKALWNHNAYFDYTDRYMAFTAANGECPGWRSMSAFTANMWDAYRAQRGPIWPATASIGPVLAPLGDQQITVGQTLTLIIRGTGPNTADLAYSASGLPAGATFSGQTFTWTPGAAQVGVYRVTFTIDDGKYRDSKTITITVTKENAAPVLGAIGRRSLPTAAAGGSDSQG